MYKSAYVPDSQLPVSVSFAYYVSLRVSNGTRFSFPAGQRDRRPLIVPGQRRQRDKDFFLSRDKGTTGQAQNLATGRDGPGFFEAVPSRPGTSRGTKLPSILPINAVFRTKIKKKIQNFFSKNFPWKPNWPLRLTTKVIWIQVIWTKKKVSWFLFWKQH